MISLSLILSSIFCVLYCYILLQTLLYCKFTTRDLSDNSFGGILPHSYSTLTDLAFLDFDGSGVTGQLPASYSTMTALLEMVLSNNAISGTIPSSYSTLQSLTVADFSSNLLSGTQQTSQLCSVHSPYSLLKVKIEADFFVGACILLCYVSEIAVDICTKVSLSEQGL